MKAKNTNQATQVNVVEMKKDESKGRKLLYDAIKSNLNPLFIVDDIIVAKSGYIPIELLEVDESYQGDREHKKINSLVQHFDWRKMDLITVVPHDDTCTFEIVDGKGRTMAASILNIESLPAKVLMDAPSDPEERRRYEAAIFSEQDKQTERLKPVEKHKSLVLQGDKVAIDLDEVLKKYHVSYKSTKGNRDARVLGSYDSAKEISKFYGRDGLEFIFSIIENAGWGNESNGYHSAFFRGLKNIYKTHDIHGERTKIAKCLSDIFRGTTPSLLLANAKTAYPTRDTRMALTLLLDDLLVTKDLSKRTYYIEPETNKVYCIKTSEELSVSA